MASGINEQGFEYRNNEPDPTPKPAPQISTKSALEQHLRNHNLLTPEEQASLDKDFPEPVSAKFGQNIGQGITGPRSPADVLDIKDHQDFINRKAEIMAAAFPNDHRNN